MESFWITMGIAAWEPTVQYPADFTLLRFPWEYSSRNKPVLHFAASMPEAIKMSVAVTQFQSEW